METEQLVLKWFQQWESGAYRNLPISTHFRHTSPYGTIEGKKAYIELIEQNRDQFLGHEFELHDAIYSDRKACVRYTAVQGDFHLDVSEWFYIKDGLIEEIISYYHIGEIRDDRTLSRPDQNQ